MDTALFAAIDLGTSYIKVGLYDAHGACHALATEEMKIDNPGAGVFLQSGEYILSSVKACVKSALAQIDDPERVKSAAFTGQMAGFMGVDEDLNDITSWSCSLDTRYYSYAKKMLAAHSRLLVEISGTNAPLMAPKIQWFETEFPDEAAKISKYMLISSYIIARLARSRVEDITIDSSFITWTGLADIASCSWSKRLCNLVGISTDKLPRIVKSNEIVAKLDAEIAAELGLEPGLPLVSGCGDKVAGIVGANAANYNDIVFEASSYGAISCIVNRYVPNLDTMNYDALPTAMGGEYILHKYIPGSGIVTKWFKDNFCGGTSYKELDDRVENVPAGSDALMCIGLLSGSNMPFKEDVRGMFIGHTLSHRPEHFFRALLESYAYEIALSLDSIRSHYPEIELDYMKLIGGGACSHVWAQIIADVTGLRVDTLSRNDDALWGTAILAGNAVGAIEDTGETARQFTNVKRSFAPNNENHAKYLKYKALYKKLFDNMDGYFAELNAI